MIRCLSWFCGDHYGVLEPGGRRVQKPSPRFSATEEIFALIERPVKYYGRMTAEARSCLCAASLALRAAGWRQGGEAEIGLISAGFEGCLQADQEYFRDYVASGRTLGRGSLFIYTLPTSALGEVAIALSLGGPCMVVHEDARPMEALIGHARRMAGDGEADHMLAMWSDPQAAVCFAVDAGSGREDGEGIFAPLLKLESSPLELIREIQLMGRQP